MLNAHFRRLVCSVFAVIAVFHARTAFAQVSIPTLEVWSRSQQGQVINKIGVARQEDGDDAQIWLSGTTKVLQVSTDQPLSTNGTIVRFTYFEWDTRGQSDPKLWRQTGAGELQIDTATLASNYMDGAWRKTFEVDGDAFVTRSQRKVTSRWYLVRFVIP